jgi:mutator protein MutT
MKKTTTVNLVFFVKDSQVLLGLKKRGFGAGRYNGVGGKIEAGETIEQSAIREAQEEIGLTPVNYEKVAEIIFDEYVKGQPEIVHMHVFLVSKWLGKLIESEEITPKWFNKNELPLNMMWPDDPYWLPQVLSGKKLKAQFKLNENDRLISHNIDYVKGF